MKPKAKPKAAAAVLSVPAASLVAGRPLPARVAALPDRLAPANLDQAMKLAEFLADSDMVPREYRGKPGNIIVAISLGHEVGLKWAQALQNIAVIGGRPTLWGDAGLGIVLSHPDYEWHRETDEATTQTATCTIKRRGVEPVTRVFSQADAERITVYERDGTGTARQVRLADRPVWKAGYGKRMRQMRARWWAMKDTFPDALKGIEGREYIEDDVTDRPADPTPADDVMPRRRQVPVSAPGSQEGPKAASEAEPRLPTLLPPPTEAETPIPAPERPPAALPSPESPGSLGVEIAGRWVQTAGITKPTLLKAYKLGAQLDELSQKGAAKDLLGREFGVEHRHELTEEAGTAYVVALVKRINALLAAKGRASERGGEPGRDA